MRRDVSGTFQATLDYKTEPFAITLEPSTITVPAATQPASCPAE